MERARLHLLDQHSDSRSSMLVLDNVSGRRGGIGADEAVKPAAVGDAMVAKGQVVGEKFAVS